MLNGIVRLSDIRKVDAAVVVACSRCRQLLLLSAAAKNVMSSSTGQNVIVGARQGHKIVNHTGFSSSSLIDRPNKRVTALRYGLGAVLTCFDLIVCLLCAAAAAVLVSCWLCSS